MLYILEEVQTASLEDHDNMYPERKPQIAPALSLARIKRSLLPLLRFLLLLLFLFSLFRFLFLLILLRFLFLLLFFSPFHHFRLPPLLSFL